LPPCRPTWKHGDAFSQLCASEGIVLVPARSTASVRRWLNAVLEGRTVLEAGAVTRQPNNQARVLLMPAIGALIEDKLVSDLEMNAAFDGMIALDDTIADEWLLWPEINFAPSGSGAFAGHLATGQAGCDDVHHHG
jgi:hypothetical protein